MTLPFLGRRQLTAAIAAAALAAAGLNTTAAADPTPDPASASPGAVSPGTPTDTLARTVTLVTGDVVTVTTLTDGQQVAEVQRPEEATGGVRIQRHSEACEPGRTQCGDLYVLPDEALPLVSAGRLDRRLFNVTDLIEMGYDDESVDALPVIATYRSARARMANPPAPGGSSTTRQLASIGGAALDADKAQARTFWNSVAGADAPSEARRFAGDGGVDRLWLDGRVEATLDESVPQVGAPDAWAAGYDGEGTKVAVLDTGVDTTHPDLADRIVETVSFVPGEQIDDVNGHGTHVASTVAGSGAASDGAYRGVAPAADLVVGKVLGDDGFGQDSWVLAGMEWAAESGAEVVNMSLGDDAQPSDGTDPMSLAVDALTAQYDTLFVVAAGNSGSGTPIGTPSAAASALTVGAVDTLDNLAWFSSTGPLAGTGAIKPDIVAPGVAITAARSAQMPGNPEPYWTIDGTSMATPHVAGAAAILAQQHPEWSAPQLKDALMSSATALADWYTPYEVGTGRLDVATATTSPVHATGSVFHGFFDWPHEPSDEPVDRTVTFSNSGDEDVTLDLDVDSTGPFSVDDGSVAVPAGGTAEVTVTGDPTTDEYGTMSGYLIGTDPASGAVTRTSLGLVKEDERYGLTIKLFDRDGNPANARVVVNQAGQFFADIFEVDGERTLRLPPGTYTVETILDVPGETADSLGGAWLIEPEVVLTQDTEVVLDASEARLLDTAAPELTEDRQRKIDFRVGYAAGSEFRESFLVPVSYDDLYVAPTGAVNESSFELATRWRLGEPVLTVSASDLPSFGVLMQAGSTVTGGQENLPVVYAGTGAASEYADLDANRKVVVVTRSDAVTAPARAEAAVAAGAKVLLVVNDDVGRLSEFVGQSPIPVASVHRDVGARLIELAESGTLKLNVEQTPYAGYIYDLTRNYAGRVPDESLAYQPSHDDLARIDARYHAVRDIEGSGYRYDMTFTPSFGFQEREWHPGTRTEWVTPGQVWHETHTQGTWEDRAFLDQYAKDSRTVLDWFKPAVHPSFGEGYSVRNARFGDNLTINVQSWTPSGADLDHGGTLDWGSVPESLKLYQGDTLIRENDISSDMQWVTVPSGTLPYRLVHDASRPADPWRLSTRTHTEWEFVSGTTSGTYFDPLALLELDYDLETDLGGDVKAGSTEQISLSAGPQAGGGPDVGKVISATLDVSYDDGATWQRVSLSRDREGAWGGKIKLVNQPGGFVSLRASAATDAGWSIEQEIIRAYGLR
jgi:subtilisin family serine protease